MRRLLLAAALVLLMVPGCALNQRQAESNPALSYLKSKDPGLLTIGDWTVLCLGGKLNAVGRVDLPGHCRVEKSNFLAIARVDTHGPRIITAKSVGSPCDNSAIHAGVDGQPIETLPLDEQVEIMGRGSIFARETQEPWPYCTIKIEETTLEAFSSVYRLMLSRWDTFRRTIAE